MKKYFFCLCLALMVLGCGDPFYDFSDSNKKTDQEDRELIACPPLSNSDDICSCMDDIIFMKYCYNHFDVNGDNMISKIEAESVREMDFSSTAYNTIRSLKGIGYFPNLDKLVCKGCKSLQMVDLRYSKITDLVSYAFSGCLSLTDVYLSRDLVSIGFQAFKNCPSLNNITIPESVKTIGYEAFISCSSLISVNIPEGVTEILSGAFISCSSLTNIFIPGSVTSMGYNPFRSCSNLATFSGPLASEDKRFLLLQKSSEQGNVAVSFAPYGIEEVIIPDRVTSIGARAFYSCQSLINCIVHEEVTSIGLGAFGYCINMQSIDIPESLTSISVEAFQNCKSLTSVIIPANVTYVGEEAFSDCDSLTSIYCKPQTPPKLGNNAFRSSSGNVIAKIYVPLLSENKYKNSLNPNWSSLANNIVGSWF